LYKSKLRYPFIYESIPSKIDHNHLNLSKGYTNINILNFSWTYNITSQITTFVFFAIIETQGMKNDRSKELTLKDILVWVKKYDNYNN